MIIRVSHSCTKSSFVFVLHYLRGPEKKGGKDEIGTLMQEHSKALKGFTYAWQPIAAADLFHLERVKSLRQFYEDISWRKQVAAKSTNHSPQ